MIITSNDLMNDGRVGTAIMTFTQLFGDSVELTADVIASARSAAIDWYMINATMPDYYEEYQNIDTVVNTEFKTQLRTAKQTLQDTEAVLHTELREASDPVYAEYDRVWKETVAQVQQDRNQQIYLNRLQRAQDDIDASLRIPRAMWQKGINVAHDQYRVVEIQKYRRWVALVTEFLQKYTT